MNSNCECQDHSSRNEKTSKEIEKISNLLKIQIRLFQESNQEVENLKKENSQMKIAMANLEELKSKAVFENEQLHKKLVDYDHYLAVKEKLKKATELIAELWIVNQQLKEAMTKK